jgi:EAL domain-containing protein (putative c-di-GMP-specific phosphodiesterase class I)
MTFPVLNHYLARLSAGGAAQRPSGPTEAATSITLDGAGRAQGRFFNCTMTSAFQPVRRLDTDAVTGYEGMARSVSAGDLGLSLWKLLDHAASDDESIELDRLCRMLHSINFFRQAPAQEDDLALYLNVHERLLGAVSSNHGHAFQRILDALGLPIERIVLQLPLATPNQRWLLNYVADNYRRNGFKLALNAASPAQALELLPRLRPQVVKLDARHLGADAPAGLADLLAACADAGAQAVFKRVETPASLALLRQAGELAGVPALAQGYLLDEPAATLLAPLQDAAPQQSFASPQL